MGLPDPFSVYSHLSLLRDKAIQSGKDEDIRIYLIELHGNIGAATDEAIRMFRGKFQRKTL